MIDTLLNTSSQHSTSMVFAPCSAAYYALYSATVHLRGVCGGIILCAPDKAKIDIYFNVCRLYWHGLHMPAPKRSHIKHQKFQARTESCHFCFNGIFCFILFCLLAATYSNPHTAHTFFSLPLFLTSPSLAPTLFFLLFD